MPFSSLKFWQTKDPEFDEEVAKFRCVQKAAQTLAQDVSVLLQGVIARHKAEMDISRNLAATLLQAAATPEMESIQRVTHETCNRLIKMFVSHLMVWLWERFYNILLLLLLLFIFLTKVFCIIVFVLYCFA